MDLGAANEGLSTPEIWGLKMTKTKVAGAKNKFGLSSIILFIGALYCLLPVAWVVIASTKSPRELFSTFSFAPGTGLWDNLMSISTYGGGQYWPWVLNSAQYAGGGRTSLRPGERHGRIRPR